MSFSPKRGWRGCLMLPSVKLMSRLFDASQRQTKRI
jgi:hypothetical protein